MGTQYTVIMYIMYLSSLSENITSELAETHTLTVRPHCCLDVHSAAAEKLVGQEVCGSLSTPKCCSYFLNNHAIRN
jgi:hypothetical protein